ncbi:hypothetical protein [Candidatus Colwellia aromaticivorans]|uniref:hypothetical protein n=1 Tax=Candidatus Colwellia aromaticivorans TaxID=2267621 RepID=UPI000DF3C3F8|nr:hypothetical protein [Candidatus Colwellia aromaticivorans]
MTINDEILILANQLANAGNKPSVAMIKAKLNKKVPLPVIISALKVWQHDPSFTSIPEEKYDINKAADITDTTVETNTFRQNLNHELAQMKQEIIELKQLVKQLIEQQKS